MLEKSTKKIKSSTKEEKQKYIICNLKKGKSKKVKNIFSKVYQDLIYFLNN